MSSPVIFNQYIIFNRLLQMKIINQKREERYKLDIEGFYRRMLLKQEYAMNSNKQGLVDMEINVNLLMAGINSLNLYKTNRKDMRKVEDKAEAENRKLVREQTEERITLSGWLSSVELMNNIWNFKNKFRNTVVERYYNAMYVMDFQGIKGNDQYKLFVDIIYI